ncbi:MAG: hypothetical protein ACE5EY_03655, partial [Anaerolineae bacterium]
FVYQLYQHFGDELVYAASGVPDVSVYAARRDDGALTLIIINLGDDPQTIPLQIEGFVHIAPAEVWRLDAEHEAEKIGAELLGDEITLPGQSITLYALPNGA